MKIFEPAKIGTTLLKNRIIRSATFEGMCDDSGFPLPDYISNYQQLAAGGTAGLITGFAYISPEGRAMHPGQAGIDSPEKIKHFAEVTQAVHQLDAKIFMQLAHTGRQTISSAAAGQVWGVSRKKSLYFNSSPQPLSSEQVYLLVEKFGQSALYAKKAGFDGVQLHAAHGYLLHQFILPSINNRKDEFGINADNDIGTRFLELIIEKIRNLCGCDFALLVKVSGGDDYFNQFTVKQFTSLISFLNTKKVDGIEISYGTMDYALNIFRGGIPLEIILKHNPRFKTNSSIKRFCFKKLIYPLLKSKLKPFTPAYNLQYAKIAKQITKIPVISTGGFRAGSEISDCLKSKSADFISLCRPLICEPDFTNKLRQDQNYISRCTNCNICAVMCDSGIKTKCSGRASHV